MQQIKDINISLKMNQIGFEVKNIFFPIIKQR